MSKQKSHEDSDAQYVDAREPTISDVHVDTQAILQNTKDMLNSTKKIMEGLLIIVVKLTAK